MATIQITSTNYNGQTAQVTFYSVSAPNTPVNLGPQTLPYSRSGDDVYGSYELNFTAYNKVCVVTLNGTTTTTTTTTSAPASDTFWADVKLLLPLDSGFTDLSTTNTTFTSLGGVSIDTSTKQFGTGSLPVGGFPAGYGISTTSAPTIGSGDFTIEWWQNFASVGSSNSTIMSWNAENFYTAWFQVRSTGTQWAVEATRYDNIDETYRNTQLLFANPSGWAHIAIVRQSGTWRVYVNGTQAASASENSTGESFSGVSGPLSFPGGNVAFGRSYGGSGGRFAPAGYIDDIRLTLVARYPNGTTFNIPTSANPQG